MHGGLLEMVRNPPGHQWGSSAVRGTWWDARNATGQGSIYVAGYRKPEVRNMMLVHFNSLIKFGPTYKNKDGGTKPNFG